MLAEMLNCNPTKEIHAAWVKSPIACKQFVILIYYGSRPFGSAAMNLFSRMIQKQAS